MVASKGENTMKEISQLRLPDDLRYAESHEWTKPEDERFRIGISDYAQDQLGDIVFVELPQVGDAFKKGDEFGTVESVKAVAELYMPIGGQIVSVNTALEESPDLVNTSPYDEGWMIEIKAADASELESLMTRNNYSETLKGLV